MRRFHYSLDDESRVGPVTFETLRAKAVAGELLPHHFVFAEHAPEWVEARHIEGLFRQPDSTTPTPPDASRPDRPRPSGLRRINSGEYASMPRPKAMTIAKGLYGPPEPAPLRYRAAAAILDGVIALALTAALIPAGWWIGSAISRLTTGAPLSAPAALAVDALALVVVPWLYAAGLECSPWRATLAKRAMDMRVVDAQQRRLTFRRATVRHFARALSLIPLGLGYFWAWTDRHDLRAWHDRLTRTRVQRTPQV